MGTFAARFVAAHSDRYIPTQAAVLAAAFAIDAMSALPVGSVRRAPRMVAEIADQARSFPIAKP
jgi:hypothetical protein